MIKIKDLEIGAAYHGEGRNFNIGIWTGTGFLGMRNKFGWIADEELHWDADQHYGTFKPYEKLRPMGTE